MRTLPLLLAGAVALGASGCATVLADKQRIITVASNPPGAQISVDGFPVGVAPAAIGVANARDHIILIQMPGHQPVQCELRAQIGVGWVVLDIVLGVLPAIVDAITNDWSQVDRDQCFAYFGAATPYPGAPTPAGYPPAPGAPTGAPAPGYPPQARAAGAARPAAPTR